MNSQEKVKKQERKEAKRKKLSEYGRQLDEKQKVKEMYGMRERQFRRFFGIAVKSEEATGDKLLSLLERRLDNVVYRLKLASTRRQARQIIVHGHVLVNDKKVYSPSYLVNLDDVISLAPNVAEKKTFLDQVVEKRLKIGIKVPEWLELDKKERKGRIIRYPVRADIQVPIEEYLIVELYSK
jgi:small subunit ribosomal protein S4